MQPTAGPGSEPLAQWREARAWWAGEPYVQFSTRLDPKGIRRVAERNAPSLGESGDGGQQPHIVDHTEEWGLRERKIRDEKVAAMCGSLPASYYERKAQEAVEQTAWAVAVRSDAETTNGVEDVDGVTAKSSAKSTQAYAPLHLISGYSFGRSVILAEELGAFAGACGCPAAAIADRHSLVGAFEFAKACSRNGVKPIIGASVELPEGGEIVLLAPTPTAYTNLSRLITECHLGEPRCFPMANWERLERHAEGLLCLTGGDMGPLDRLLVRRDFETARRLVDRLVGVFGQEDVFIEIERSYLPWGIAVERRLLELAEATGVVPVAGGAVVHARRSHFPAQDVLQCAESLCLIDEVIGRKPRRDETQPEVTRYPERGLNAERYFHSSAEMAVLFADRPDLLANTLRVAERCEDNVLPRRTQLPQLFPDDTHALREIVAAEALAVYGTKLSNRHRRRLDSEVARIQKMGFASHFLVAWDFCRWAREQAIGMSGRGSVVDSAVAYVLGLSRIDAIAHNLHFDRFLPNDGHKRPDIDIDFEARRRDDVRGYMVRRYGVERVGAVCAIGAYGSRGIVREVGKVFGLPDATIGFLAKRIHGGVSASQLESALEKRPELRDSNIPKERFRWVLHLADRLMDVPRDIRTHSSGVVISATPIHDLVPTMWSATPASEESGVSEDHLRMIQWDKRSAKHVFDKFDILCLRGQDVLGGVEARVRKSDPDFSVDHIDASNDPEVYRAMRSGELIGIPQSASPAMRQAHQRLQTNNLHDASLVQAGIRPGVGGAVKLNELIARRRGKPYTFEHPDLEAILGHSYGLIVFQEQVDQLLQTCCGYTSGQAEDIRDAIYKKRREGLASTVRDNVVGRALEKGYPPAVAERVYELVSQFTGYGFAQGHALAFAEVSLRSVSLMQNKPSEYFASLLSAQPAGYYSSCTIANEARTRGITILPLDINRSRHRFEVESAVEPTSGLLIPSAGVRTGLMQLSGLSAPTRDRILELQGMSLEAEMSDVLQPLKSIAREEGGTAVGTLDRGGIFDDRPRGRPRLQAFGSFFDFAAKVEPSRDELEALILAGALDSLHPNRRALLWAVPAAQDFARGARPRGPHPELPFDLVEPPLDPRIEDFSPEERAVHERALLGMDIERHLMAFERPRVRAKGAFTTNDARRLPAGTMAVVVGNPIRLRFPPTASGKRVVFFDLEDETGLLNVTCFDETYQRDGHAIVTSQYVTIRGMVQDRDGHTAFLAHRVFPYTPTLMRGHAVRLPVTATDFLVG